MRKTTEAVFYAETYHPIQAGSIDGTDTHPHDSAVYRAWLCSSAGLYDPSASAVSGDPYCTLFVARLSPLTTEDTLRHAMSRYGRVKNLRLVRHIVTGASRGYAFVEFETERDMRRAYKEAHHSLVDDYEVIVDYNRQQLMPGWIPRRLGGGFGGKKESGQLRFGGRERPFRAPIRIPYDDLKKLGIPPPPEGRYVSRHEVPSPPRRKRSSLDREEGTRRRSIEREASMYKSNHVEKEGRFHKRSMDREYCSSRRSSVESDHRHCSRSSRDREEGTRRRSINREASVHASSHVDIKESFRKVSVDQEDSLFKRSSVDREERSHKRRSRDKEDRSHKRSSGDREERSHKRHKSRHYERSTSKERSEEI